MIAVCSRSAVTVEKGGHMSTTTVPSEAEPLYVTSVGELVDIVTDISADGHILWYRAHRIASWDVLPSIHRGYSPLDEQNFTNRFRSRAAIRYSAAPEYDARGLAKPDAALWVCSLSTHSHRQCRTSPAAGAAGDVGEIRCRRPCRRPGCSSGGGPGCCGPGHTASSCEGRRDGQRSARRASRRQRRA